MRSVPTGADGDPPPGPPPDNVLTESWLRSHGYVRAADERARQMRMARAALDELLCSEPARGDAA